LLSQGGQLGLLFFYTVVVVDKKMSQLRGGMGIKFLKSKFEKLRFLHPKKEVCEL
jgi:hypothetical protein